MSLPKPRCFLLVSVLRIVCKNMRRWPLEGRSAAEEQLGVYLADELLQNVASSARQACYFSSTHQLTCRAVTSHSCKCSTLSSIIVLPLLLHQFDSSNSEGSGFKSPPCHEALHCHSHKDCSLA